MNPNLEKLARETKNSSVQLEKPITEALVYVNARRIYAYAGGQQRQLDYRRWNEHEFIRALCFHDNELYVGGNFGVEKVFSGQKISKDEARHLFSANGTLWQAFDNSMSTPSGLGKLFHSPIWCAYGYGDSIWFSIKPKNGQADLGRFEIADGKLTDCITLDRKDHPIRAICGHEDSIYYACRNQIYKLGDKKPVVIISEPTFGIDSIASVNGRLYIAEANHVSDVGGNMVAKSENGIVDMCAVPIEWLQRSGYL
jgi:hypothetical protein